VGIIALAGAFSGVVSVHLSESVVRGAASQMFQAPAGAVDADEMRDAVAELTNMVGGNVKCLVPQPTQLGLPEVLTRAEAEGRLCPTVEEARLGFASPDGRLFVMLHQSAAA
jgi:chemotaxis protein CheX